MDRIAWRHSRFQLHFTPRALRGRILKVQSSGGWKAARTRTLESVRYVAQPFQAAAWRSFPAPQRAPACGGPWWQFQDARVFGEVAEAADRARRFFILKRRTFAALPQSLITHQRRL